MNAAAYVSALAALAGSLIGALASFGTTWLNQRAQDRAQRKAQEIARRERLYGDFIDEASRLFADALTHRLEDPSKMVRLYAIKSKLILFASAEVVERAEEVLGRLVETYRSPNLDFQGEELAPEGRIDLLHDFSEACRADL